MIIKEIKSDLFNVPSDYLLVHCISQDFALDKGIAVQFNRHYNMRQLLIDNYPEVQQATTFSGGDCLLIHRVFNLVTKFHYYDKPTYESLGQALIYMKKQMEQFQIAKIAMPTIGCGLDRLNWKLVKQMLETLFANTPVEILVCFN